ncbi:MAG: hypothetical protein IT420_07195 [Candidatus Brocadia sp.]|nr:hypothetical protein [Candidatus Brocadia sp.]
MIHRYHHTWVGWIKAIALYRRIHLSFLNQPKMILFGGYASLNPPYPGC